MPKPTSPKQAAPTPPAPPAPVKPVPTPPSAVNAAAGPTRRAPSHFLRDVLLALVIGGAALGYYYKRVQTSTQVNHVAKKAKDLIEKDTPQDFYEAEKQLKKALDLDSSNAYSLSALAEMDALLWGEDGVADRRAPAEDYVRKADEVDPHFAERYSADSLVKLYGGQPAEAEKVVRAIIEKGARGARLYDALGRALRAQGKLEEAKKAFVEGTKLGRIPRFNVDLAQLYFDEGDLVNADTFVQKALETNPDHPRAQILRARIGVARGLNIKTATDDLLSLLGHRKSDLTPTLLAEAFTAKAALQLFNRQAADAVREAQEAVRADPRFADGHQILGLALVQTNNVGQALNEFDRARTLDPYVPAFYFEAAKALAQAKEIDKAVAILGKVSPKDEQYHLAYGDLLFRKGDKAGAMAEFDQALRQNQLSAQAYYGKGLILAEEKKIPEAGKAFEAAFGARPNYAEAHQQLGYLLLLGKKAEDAASEFEQALQMYAGSQAPREKLIALRDEFIERLKKGAPKGLVQKFQDDCKQIIH